VLFGFLKTQLEITVQMSTSGLFPRSAWLHKKGKEKKQKL